MDGPRASQPTLAADPPAPPRPACPLTSGAHIPALDSIRGLAILLVLVYHFNVGPAAASGLGRAFTKALQLGGCGVDLFFVLSGFLITGILFDAKGAQHYFRDFYVRRTLRIFPLYYGTLLVAFVLLPLASTRAAASLREAASLQGWLWLYGSNLLLAWREAYPLGGFNHFWSLAVEEHFYLAWPLVIHGASRKQGMVACLACIVAAPALRLALVATGDHPISPYVLTPCRMDALAAGALLALAIRGSRGVEAFRVPARWSLASCVLASAGIFLWKGNQSHMDATALVLRSTLCSWLFGSLLILAVTATPGGLAARLWEARFLRVFGKYSYGLYVFHYPLIPLFEAAFPPVRLAEATGSVVLGRILFIAVATAASLALALASWSLYERPFLRLKDVLTGRGGGASPAIAADGRPRPFAWRGRGTPLGLAGRGRG